VPSSPEPKRGEGHSPAGEGLGESQFRQLEKSLALCLLCAFRLALGVSYKKWTQQHRDTLNIEPKSETYPHRIAHGVSGGGGGGVSRFLSNAQCTCTLLQTASIRGSQRDVVYLGWPLAPSYSIWARMRDGGAAGSQLQWVQQCTWSPNQLWRSNSIFTLWPPSLFVLILRKRLISAYPRWSRRILWRSPSVWKSVRVQLFTFILRAVSVPDPVWINTDWSAEIIPYRISYFLDPFLISAELALSSCASLCIPKHSPLKIYAMMLSNQNQYF
jgi:hypothetical protein